MDVEKVRPRRSHAGPWRLLVPAQLALKAWFPGADVAQMVGRRPSLLTAEEFARVPAARRQLLAR